MKIAIISFHCCPFSLIGGDGVGGMNVFVKELCSVLTDIPGVTVDIFTRIQDPSVRGIKVPKPSLRVVHLKGGPEAPCDRKRIYDHLPEFALNLERFMSREAHGYDLVYSHYWLSGVVGEWLKYRSGYPLVHTYHTLGFLKKKALGEAEHEKRISRERCLAKAADMIVSTSAEEKKGLMAETGASADKIRVIYPGVNKSLFYPVAKSEDLREMDVEVEDRILLYVGRIEPVKGLMSVVEAFQLLKGRRYDLSHPLRLVVVGGGNGNTDFLKNREILRIKRAIKANDLMESVIFLGSKRQPELRKYYSLADALIVPSLYESFGLVVLESLACGTPVLVSQIGKMKTIVKEGRNGFCFQPNDPRSLSECLEHFYAHRRELWPAERIRRDIVEKFSWEKSGGKIYGAFMELLQTKRFPTTIFQPGESPQLV